jgi:CBS domain containing-hemolysin-like protein
VTPIEISVAVLALVVVMLSAAVTAVVRDVDAVRALGLAEEGVAGADALLWLTERPLTTHRVSAVISVLGAVAIGIATPLPDLLAGVLAVLAVLVVAPLLARTVVAGRTEQVGLRLAPIARPVVDMISRPIGLLEPATWRAGEDVDGAGQDEEDRGPNGDEDTVLDAGERRMILSILELDDTTAREIMVPRPDVVAVPKDARFADVVDVALEHGRSRLPVHEPEDADAVTGVVHVRDLLARLRSDTSVLDRDATAWSDLVRSPHHVPESRRAGDLLRDLQEAAVHLALVVDEYGEVVGIVTIEDVLEEIVGEIVDEHDDERPVIEPIGPDRWRVDGGMNVADLGDALGVQLPDEAWDTVGGLVLGTLGRLPRVGDRVEVDGLVVTVTVRRGRRVVEVHVERASSTGGSGSEQVAAD